MKSLKLVQFAVIAGSISDLSTLDLSMWRLKIYHINSKEIKEYFKNVSNPNFYQHNWEFLNESKKSISSNHETIDSDYLHVIVPSSLKTIPIINDYYQIVNALVLLHPSVLAIKDIYTAQIFKNKINFISRESFDFSPLRDTNDSFEYYFHLPVDLFSSTNNFLKIFKKRIDKLEYVKKALRYYLDSYKINDIQMAFLSLCICLESIVPGPEQLSFRLRRNLSVLCGETISMSEQIFLNVGKLYSYRSKLVHSDMQKKDLLKIVSYYNYSKIIASKMLVEMILQNIPTIKELDNILNKNGFGSKKRLVKNYKPFDGDKLTRNIVLTSTLN